MENKSKIPMYITLKQLNKPNNVKTTDADKNIRNLIKFKMLPCLYYVIESLMNINEAA